MPLPWFNSFLNPKATEGYIKVQTQILFPFSFKTVELLAEVFSCNPLTFYQRKYASIQNTENKICI